MNSETKPVPSLSIDQLRERRDKYARGVDKLEKERARAAARLEEVSSDLIATSGGLQAVSRLIAELEAPSEPAKPAEAAQPASS